MHTLRAFVFHLQHEIIIVPTSEECCKDGENTSSVLERPGAHRRPAVTVLASAHRLRATSLGAAAATWTAQ